MPAPIIDSHSLPVALRLLRATIVEPWESVDQVLTDHGKSDLGDPLLPGTGAWHLRHIVEIFRLHARTVVAGLGDDTHASAMPSPEAPIPRTGPWSPVEARNELLADVDAFSTWLLRQPPDALARPFTYGPPTDLTTMFSTMLQHICWHAAAVHYWRKWKSADPASR